MSEVEPEGSDDQSEIEFAEEDGDDEEVGEDGD